MRDTHRQKKTRITDKQCLKCLVKSSFNEEVDHIRVYYHQVYRKC